MFKKIVKYKRYKTLFEEYKDDYKPNYEKKTAKNINHRKSNVKDKHKIEEVK